MIQTQPRQVRLLKCALLSPGLSLRAGSPTAAAAIIANGFDLLPYVVKIDIYESLFENTLSATVALAESVGLTEYLPIVGMEGVVIIFQVDDPNGTNDRTFTRVFRVVGLKNQAFPKHDFRLYMLHLATAEFVQSVSARVCRAYHAVNCVDAVTDILTTDLQVDPRRIQSHVAEGTVDVVIPNYTPLMAINYFAMLAQTVGKLESNFLFYETMLGGFHFQNISALITTGKASPMLTFNVDSGNITSSPDITETDLAHTIFQAQQTQGFDLLFDIASGMLRSRMVNFDFLARKLDHTVDSRYTTTFPQTTHLDTYPVYPLNLDLTVEKNVRMFMVPSNAWSTKSAYINSLDAQPEQRMHEAIVLRNRQLKEIKHVETLLNVPGQPTIQAGSVVTVLYPTSRALQGLDIPFTSSFSTQPTPYYSGAHLVTAIHHTLTTVTPGSMDYRMTLKVNRDSLGSPLIGGPNSSET